MDFRSQRLTTHADGSRLSSSFAHQRWSQHSSYYSFPLIEAPLQESPRQYETVLDEYSSSAYRTTALRQLNGIPKPWSLRKYRQATSTHGRPSSSVSQPVLVKSYSGDAGTRTAASRMSPRRRLFFKISAQPQERGPALPSAEEFRIENILRAIEPDIRNTLDSIAEICGRSKLSLANEYGSHIAPLGEIRAPPGGLVTVEEASPDHERQPTTDGVAIFDDDNSLADWRDHHHPFSYYGYMEGIRQTAAATRHAGSQSMMPLSIGEGPLVPAEPDTPGSAMVSYPAFEPDPELPALPTTREFTSAPKSSGRALLGRRPGSTADVKSRSIVTPAVVSEVHLDAQADSSSLSLEDDTRSGNMNINSNTPRRSYGQSVQARVTSMLPDLQGLLSWFKGTKRDSISGSCQSSKSAEIRLRTMLERENADSTVALRTA